MQRIAESTRSRFQASPEAEQKAFLFALDLTFQSDYYRAVTEYKRLASLYPDSKLKPDAALLSAICTLFAERVDEAARLLESMSGADPDIDALRQFLLAYAHFERRRLGECDAALARITHPDWKAERDHLQLLSWIVQGQYDRAREMAPDRVKTVLAASSDLSSRSPVAAGMMSGVLPGSGQLYCGRPGDAAAAFFLTGLFGAATWEAVDEDLPIVAGLTAAVGLIFYIGNVYGGVNAAHRYNEETHLQFQREAIESTRGSGVYWNLQNRPGALRPFDPRR